VINTIRDIEYNNFFGNVQHNIISFAKGVCLKVVERINKGISLCASKYQLLSVLNISPPLTQGRLIGVIIPPV